MRLKWDEVGKRFYETGVSKGVLYPQDKSGEYPKGVAWSGLTEITENPTGAEPTAHYADNIKYLNLMSAEEFGATIEAYTYPDEFAACDGTAEPADGVYIGQQGRRPFGLAYTTQVGNDTESHELGYKIHLVYGAMASPSDKSYSTINDSPEAINFSWTIETTPVAVEGMKPTATVVLDSTKIDEDALAQIEDILYGTEDEEARLPLPDELLEIVGGPSAFSDEDNELDFE